MRSELVCEARRWRKFARFRARQRNLDGMVNTILYAKETANFRRKKNKLLRQLKSGHFFTARPGHGPAEAERAAYQQYKMGVHKLRRDFRQAKSKPHIVVFGNGKFGHKRAGPVPKKVMVRALSAKVPVLLVDEFRTTKCCHRCGHFTKKDPTESTGRRLHCTNENCGAIVNRDVNAAANMGQIGTCMLVGNPRPTHLSRAR